MLDVRPGEPSLARRHLLGISAAVGQFTGLAFNWHICRQRAVAALAQRQVPGRVSSAYESVSDARNYGRS
jgi:hypothetical protein